MPAKPESREAASRPILLAALQTKQVIPEEQYKRIAAVHNSNLGHWGLAMTKKRLNDPSVTDRMISEFIRQCPCCQVMSRLRIPIKTHPFTCASYNPFEVLHLDHIGPLRPDEKGNLFILVIIDAFSRWVELYPTKTTTAVESASCIFQHFGRFGNAEVVHTDRGTAFHNELIEELLRMSGTEQSLTTANSSEENGIVERANQEVLRHLNAILFDSRVHDRWSFEQLPMVQRIMNTVEKTSTGVTPAQLILNNSISLSSQILQSQRVMYPPDTTRPDHQVALSDRMDEWISRQTTLIKVARDKQSQTDFHSLVEYDATITEYPVNSYVLFTPPVGRGDKLLPKHRGPYQVIERSTSIYTIENLVDGKRSTTHIHNLRPFNYDPARTSPLVVAQHNEQEFVVESIQSHRGDRTRRSSMEFKVRWSGFGESCDTWEPYKALLHVDKLHEYLRTNRMKTLIPGEHK
jgi:transposase InsO family protein